MAVSEQLQMCQVGDIKDGEDCRRLARQLWQLDPDDHPVYLCNFHSEPLIGVPGVWDRLA